MMAWGDRVRAVAALELPALLAVSLCVGLAGANLVRVAVWPTAVAAAVLGLGVTLCRRAGWACLLAAASLVLLGAAWGSLRLSQLDRSVLVHRLGQPGTARVVVTAPPRGSAFAVRAFATVRRFAGRPLNERVLLALPPERAPPQGSVIELRRAWPVEPRRPQDGFDEQRWLARKGIHVVLRADGFRVVGQRGGIGGVADRLRAHIERTVASGTRGERRALLSGVVLGASHAVGDELESAFRDSGLLHLMAVSGQNIALIVAGVLGLCWLAAVPLLWARWLSIGAVIVYALAVGWQPSVVRATVAGVLVSLAWIASRPRDRWHALALGGVVLLGWMPASILEPGFQLSFVAVAAIFVAVPRLARKLEGYPIPGWFAGGAALAIACSLATAPIVLLQFGSVPLWGVPANVAAEGAMPPLLGLCLLAAAVEPLSASAAAALVWLAGWCAAWLALCARAFSELPYATLGRLPATVVLLAVVVGALAFARLPRYRRRPAAIATLSLVVTATAVFLLLRPGPPWQPPTGLRVTFLDVGQGDSALVEAPGVAVLVDQGPPEADVAGQLRRLGLPSLSMLVLTHPQRDHIGGAPMVMERFAVGVVLDPMIPSPSSEHDAVVRIATDRGTRLLAARVGDVYRFGALRLRVLWPDGPGRPGTDPNQRAVVILASYGDADVLLTADAESDVTGRLPLGQVEVMKVAHHGSEDPGLADQLRVLRPRIAVISVGEGNDYGHPRNETVAVLEAVPRLRLLRTDLDGRVVVESDGRTVTVRSER
jgi:competence protein ComEC